MSGKKIMSQRGQPKRRGAAGCRREASSIRRPPLAGRHGRDWMSLVYSFRAPAATHRLPLSSVKTEPFCMSSNSHTPARPPAGIPTLATLVRKDLHTPARPPAGIAVKNRIEFYSKFLRFLHRFLDAFWLPSGSHLAPKIAPKIDPGRP